MEAEGKVIKHFGGRGYYALVQLRCTDIGCQPAAVTLDPSAVDEWYHRQGFADSAISGVQIGLALADTSAKCTITRIHGMVIDTTQCTVAIAAVRATWQALGVEPCKNLAERIESALLKRPSLSIEELARKLLVNSIKPHSLGLIPQSHASSDSASQTWLS